MTIAWDLTIPAIGSILLLTILYKYNPLFKFMEHTLVGVTFGYTFIVAYNAFLNTGVTPLTRGDTIVIVPILLGILLFTRLHKQSSWLSRWPLSVMVGTALGVAVRAAVGASFTSQIQSMFIPLAGKTASEAFNLAIGVIITLTALTVFVFYAVPRYREAFTGTQRIGRIVIMLSFGAALAGTLMTRTGFLIRAIRMILVEWLGLG